MAPGPGGNPSFTTSSARIAFRNTRRVWALLSQGERGVPHLCRIAKLNRQTVYRALRRLKAAGYIAWEYNFIVVLVPFIVTGCGQGGDTHTNHRTTE